MKKGLAIGIIFLFLFSALAPLGIGSIVKKEDDSKHVSVSSDPKADLECWGSIYITPRLKPGYNLTTHFQVWNVGDPSSYLNWQIISWPSWGTWSFNPSNGTGLELGSFISVYVNCTIPDQEWSRFHGVIMVVNIDDPSDFVDLKADIRTSKNIASYNILYNVFIDHFPILKEFLYG